ncbi:hypothetical protein ACFOOP_10160 [Marinicaulis aureus]|uniref:Alpha/beta hydrolase n=1 Tax=Hyphococcus aureus TaxID=2666033 RepID=A0ABW1L213_9PROT
MGMANSGFGEGRHFVILTVHGTFAGDAGRCSEYQRRKAIGRSDEVLGLAVDDCDIPESEEDYAPLDWWSDDGASDADCDISARLSPSIEEELRYIGLTNGKKVRYYKRIQNIPSRPVFDAIAIRRVLEDEDADKANLEFKKIIADSDPFIGLPGIIHKISCLARALGALDSATDGPNETRLYIRAIRWPNKHHACVNPLERYYARKGENSEYARRAAARQLKNEIDFLEDRRIAYAIVGHSHGGTVAHDALASMPKRNRRNLKGLITFGAPVIRMSGSWLAQKPWTLLPSHLTWIIGALLLLIGFCAGGDYQEGGFFWNNVPFFIGGPTLFALAFGVLYYASHLFMRPIRNGRIQEILSGRGSAHFRHRDDEIVSAFENLYNKGGKSKIQNKVGEQAAIPALVIQLRSALFAGAATFTILFAASGINAGIAQSTGLNFLNSLLEAFGIDVQTGAFCTGLETMCSAKQRFYGVAMLSGITLVGLASFVLLRVIFGPALSKLRIYSATNEAINIFIAGMRKNLGNIAKIGPIAEYTLLSPEPDEDKNARRYHDVASAISGVRSAGLPEFGSILAELPKRLVESSKGRFSHWAEYSERVLGSPGIIHNAYCRSETFMLFLAAKLSTMMSDDLRPHPLIFDIAEQEAFRRDFGEYFAALANLSDDEGSAPADLFEYDRYRWRTWLAGVESFPNDVS